MSKVIVGVVLGFIVCFQSCISQARETKKEKRQHAKNLQALLYEIDNLLLEPPSEKWAVRTSRILEAFDKVSVKLINKKAVNAKREEIKVIKAKPQLRAFRKYLEKMFVVRLAPSMTPNKEKGAKIYKKYCSSCHGAAGAGDGIFASRLSPAPRSFLSETFRDNITPHMVFNYTVFGIPSGIMKSHSEILGYYDLWCLSFYVSGLPFDGNQIKPSRTKIEPTLEQLASSDLNQLESEKVCSNLAEKSYLRTVLPYNTSKSRR